MDKLTERALEMRGSLMHCAVAYDIYACRQCAYFQNGCRNELMLDAVNVIERLIENVDNGK